MKDAGHLLGYDIGMFAQCCSGEAKPEDLTKIQNASALGSAMFAASTASAALDSFSTTVAKAAADLEAKGSIKEENVQDTCVKLS